MSVAPPGSVGDEVEIVALELRPLRVPLVEPFVISSGAIATTDAVEIALTIEAGGRRARGLGECATLAPVTKERADEIEAAVGRLELIGRRLPSALDGLALAEASAEPRLGPVARAGLETAWLDALARLDARPLARALAQASLGRDDIRLEHEIDVTIPIASPARMGELARAWSARGFRSLKVKVGRGHDEDVRALSAIVRAAPSARLRLDANAALRARDALRLLDAVRALGGDVELFEQPCGERDLDGMAELVRLAGVPIIADESCKTLEDVARLVDANAATGVNLKLVKHGGPLASLAIARAARERGLSLMAGAMVETRLGLAAMLHVVAALGGVDYLDLDTALLLADDPYEGGYESALPTLRLDASAVGVGVDRRASAP